ncbi:MAG TPA: hypothetical protein ENJ33_00445, partial [Thiothrix sp.]|nr:hypothetical protein [Thiothrix sp.]
PTSLIGSAFKGPIDGAVTRVTDAAGTIIATSDSSAGKFEFPAITLPTDGSAAIFIETIGGSYTDEATNEPVTPTGKGLMTVFTVDELNTIISGGKVMALTPETTLMAQLVKKMLADGKTASVAITDAKAIIQAQLLDDTNPAQGTSGDSLLMIGDLSAGTPADQAEALARNRAISFSIEANTLNLSPVQVFDLIDKRALDLEDGTLDGKEADGTTAITITDKDGATKELGADQKNSYGLARTKLLNNTLTRLGNGDLSDAEKAELEKLGFDTGYFDNLNDANAAAAAKTIEQLAATNLPSFNHLPVLTDEDGNATDNAATYTLTATPNINVTVTAPGESWTTPMLRYNGLQLPPVIKANRGDTMTLNLVNNLTDETTIHWHGFKIPGDQDGGPDFPVAAGGSKTYSFPMLQPAAPLWFHPHPDMKTGEQVYNGLAGVYLLDDAISKQLVTDKNLPADSYDIPVLIQDRRFKEDADANGVTDGVRELLYKMNADGTANEMDNDGMLGSKILVNGAELPQLNVETRQYRFRLYNTSNARSYEFALTKDGTTFEKFKVIGTDGGLLAQPVEVESITLGAAERAEVIIDFGNHADSKLMLVSKAFNGSPMMGMGGMGNGGGMGGMGNGGGMGGMGNGSGMGNGGMNGMVVNGMRMDIMRFDVTTTVTDDVVLYTDLPADADINTQRLAATDASKTRNFVMTMGMGNTSSGMGGGMSFVINGQPFDMNVINETITLADGDTEIWSIQNRSPMAHPFHAHAIQWQILDRNGVAATGIDLGWKDTVLVQPGETVNFIGKFDPAVNTGDYMYHCHILEHEDAGMMGFFRIQ